MARDASPTVSATVALVPGSVPGYPIGLAEEAEEVAPNLGIRGSGEIMPTLALMTQRDVVTEVLTMLSVCDNAE